MSARAPLVVVGDALLDIDVTGDAERLSPDDPAPVLQSVAATVRPGGAALAAALAAALEPGRPVVLATRLGSAADPVLTGLPATVRVLDLVAQGETAVKTRVRAAGRTIVRLDHPARFPALAPGAVAELSDVLAEAAAVLVADYALGLTADPQIRALLARESRRRPLVWDPHPRGAEPVPGTALVTPNAAEARAWSGIPGADLSAACDQGEELRRRWQAWAVAVTRGPAGAVLLRGSTEPEVLPALAVASGDTCGAGDMLAARCALTLADGADPGAAVAAGIAAATAFVRRGGAARWDSPAVSVGTDSADVVAEVRRAGGTVVLAAGCFDLLHAGHVHYLQQARSLGDCLVVAVNDDESVRRLKGPPQPVMTAADRAAVLAELSCVDAVCVFSGPTPQPVIEQLRPDIFAKGADYRGQELPERAAVEAGGGRVVLLPLLDDRSSTRLRSALAPTPTR